MNLWLMTAALLAGATMVVHLVAGGRLFARPLLALDVGPTLKATHYFCWHIVTLTLGAWAAALAWLALAWLALAWLALAWLALADGDWVRPAAFGLAGLAAAIAGLNLVIGVRQTGGIWPLPQWAFFLPLAIVTVAGA